MISFYKGIPIINDDPATRRFLDPQWGQAKGYVPRDYSIYPETMLASPSEMKVFPESDWDAWYDEQEAQESSMEHIFLPGGKPAFINLDQNGDGYCWGYSVGQTMMIERLIAGQPHVRLNPHGTCAIIKGGADEGGWAGLSAKFSREVGYGVEGTGDGQWPLHSRNLKYDTPAFRASCALHKVTEDWVDLTKAEYDQNLTKLQVATCLFQNHPCAVDFNHWSHSVCGIRWVRIEKGSWGILILNSWLGWGRFGLGVLEGSKAIPDGAVCTRVTTASVA